MQAEPLVLLPGTLCDERIWAQVIPLSGAARTDAMATAVIRQAPDRFALAGFSLGGIVALEVVAQAPERVARLALIDTNPHPDPPARQTRRHAASRRARETGLAAHSASDLAPHNFAAPHPDGAAMVAAMTEGFSADDYANQCGIAAARADSRPRSGAISVPPLSSSAPRTGSACQRCRRRWPGRSPERA